MSTHASRNEKGYESLFRRLQKNVNYLRECPLCKEVYNEDHVDVLYDKDNVHLIHITCFVCNNKLMALLASSQLGMSSVGMITELTATDVLRVQDMEPVSEDDVLSFHSYLAKNPQRFLQHFAK